MPALSTFSDFQALTRDIKITGPEEILNEAVSHNYILGDMLAGRDNDHIFRGSAKLVERISGYDNGGFQTYTPNQELNPTAVDTIRRISANWRFTVGNYAWNDEEILLNEGDPIRYGDLKFDYEQGAMTSIVNGMENLLIAAPSTTDMEADAGTQPYSIPCFVQEGGASVTMGGRPIGFTTLMGLDPNIEAWWQNQCAGYTGANIGSADSATGLFGAFDTMLRLVQFMKLNVAQMGKYFEDLNLRKMRIYTNGDGRDTFMRLLRAKNNQLRVEGPQDAAYPDPRFQGYPVEWVEKLNTAPLYGTSGQNSVASTFNTDGSAKTGYPRFYFLNLKYLYAVFHGERYFYQKMMEAGAKQPFTHVMWINTYYNVICRSRRRQGIVYPNVV